MTNVLLFAITEAHTDSALKKLAGKISLRIMVIVLML